MQVWPAFWSLEKVSFSAARSRSASAKTTNGACPPSSRLACLPDSAQRAASIRPTSREPVKDTWRTSGALRKTSPIGSGSPQTRLSTPGGKPASAKTSNSSTADSGVCSAGLSTTVLPAATAGASLRVIIALGKFHGRDAGHDAARAAAHVEALTRPVGGQDLAPRAADLLRVPEQELRAPAHLALGLGERLAALQRERARQLARPLEHERVGAPQRRGALVGRQRRPAREGGVRRRHRRARLLGARRDDRADRLARRGIRHRPAAQLPYPTVRPRRARSPR